MKFTKSSDSRYLSAFNFSSLTDIVMLLLIFFLLTSSFVTTKGLDVVLPEATHTEKQQDLRLYVSLDKEGKITVNNQDVTKETLPGVIVDELLKDSTLVVVIRADQELPYSEVVTTLDLVKGAGAKRFFLATEKPKE